MKTKKILPFSVFTFSLIVLLYYSCAKDQGKLPVSTTLYPCDTAAIKYSTDIQPIIQAKCAIIGCHVKGGTGNGNFTLFSALSAYADPPVGNGAIRARVIRDSVSATGNGWMPAGNPLPAADRAKIDCWLKAGAPNN